MSRTQFYLGLSAILTSLFVLMMKVLGTWKEGHALSSHGLQVTMKCKDIITVMEMIPLISLPSNNAVIAVVANGKQ